VQKQKIMHKKEWGKMCKSNKNKQQIEKRLTEK